MLKELGNCPHCGAPLTSEITSGGLLCQYCKSVIAIETEKFSDVETHTGGNFVDTRIHLREVTPELTFPANFKENAFNAQGGHLWITRDEVVFKPHVFNFGNLGKKYIRIADVAGYKKGFLTNFSIFTTDGFEMKLVINHKDTVINAIEERRCAYFESRGMSVPALKYGDV